MIEKVCNLEKSLAIYKATLETLREQDVNARVMKKDKFDLLVSNIKKDDRLEQLPFCSRNPERENELLIISGHHRVRAARAAGFDAIYVLVDENLKDNDYIKAKQLSHNSINGYDDPQILQEIYDQIKNIEAKIMAGVNDELQEKLKTINVEEIKINIDYEFVNIVFLSRQKKNFEDVIALINASADIMYADLELFDEFKNAIREVAKKEDIRNIGMVISKMSEITKLYYEEQDAKKGNG